MLEGHYVADLFGYEFNNSAFLFLRLDIPEVEHRVVVDRVAHGPPHVILPVFVEAVRAKVLVGPEERRSTSDPLVPHRRPQLETTPLGDSDEIESSKRLFAERASRVDPLAQESWKRREVALGAEYLRLESADLAGGSGVFA
jgi:hypothetical protein